VESERVNLPNELGAIATILDEMDKRVNVQAVDVQDVLNKMAVRSDQIGLHQFLGEFQETDVGFITRNLHLHGIKLCISVAFAVHHHVKCV